MTDPGWEVDGPPGADLIVFIHSTRLTRTMWRPQIEALRDTFRVVAVDLPGHGSQVATPFTLEAAAEHVAAAIRAEGGTAVVVGLSLGGYVGMDVAARYPGFVRGLVVSGSTAEPVAWRAVPYRVLATVLERFDGPRLDAVNRWFFRTRFPAAIADPIVEGGFWYAGGADALRALVGQSFVGRLASYPGPTLLLNGTYDVPFRLSARTFANAARRPQRVRLRGATHLANLDRPAAFSTAVRRFAEALSAGPPEPR